MAKGKSNVEQKDGMGFSILAFVMSVISLICLKVIVYDEMTQTDTSVNPVVILISAIHDSVGFQSIFHVVALAAVVVSAVCLSFAIQRGNKKNSVQSTLTFLATAYDVLFLLTLITSQVTNFIPLP